MKKLFATFLLLMLVSVPFAGTAGANGAIHNPKNDAVCYDKDGRWDPQNKSCDPESCGCLFHRIEEFIVDLFK